MIGASEYLLGQIRYGIMDISTVPFKEGIVLPLIPQTEKYSSFAGEKLPRRLKKKVYEEVSKDYAMEQVKKGKMISYSFVA